MKAVILAGGLGSRLAEETSEKPKPMVEIGGKPILWHIMKIYSTHGINDFIICGGYKSYVIKEYFANYFLHSSNVTFDIKNNSIEVLFKKVEPWKVTIIDTGDFTQTGGRLKRVSEYLDDEFCMTYGDGVGSVDISALVKFHRSHRKLATMTAVKPPGRFGSLQISGTSITSFLEKPEGDGGWINGGFFVLHKNVIDLITSDDSLWEKEPLESLAKQGQLEAFFHNEFWLPMDTVRDKKNLEELWVSGIAPWKIWE